MQYENKIDVNSFLNEKYACRCEQPEINMNNVK